MGGRDKGWEQWASVALWVGGCGGQPAELAQPVEPAGSGAVAGSLGMPEQERSAAGTATDGPSPAGTTAGSGGGQGVAGQMGDTGGAGAAAAPAAGVVAVGDDAGVVAETPTSEAPWRLPAVSDYGQPGPFSSTMESNTGPGGNYALFRPDPLGSAGFRHPVITFGPGILTSPATYTTLLNHLASHGYVIVVVNSLSAGPGAQANVDAMREGLDWLIAQDREPGPFEGVLAVERAVPMGYSLGATAAVQLASHPAVLTTVSIHGHRTSGDPLGPVLLLTGTEDVIGSVRQTHGTLDEAPAMLAALPIGHLEVLSELSTQGRYLAPITAWVRYWVNGDGDAKRFFWGPDCVMCSSPWIPPETTEAWDALSL